MITKKQYYDRLYRNLICNHKDEFSYCLERDISETIVPPKGEKYIYLKTILDEVERKYGFNMKLNHVQLTLWQKAFGLPNASERVKEDFYVAGTFVIFCCLVDNFLDSPRFTSSEKLSVCQKIELFDFENEAFSGTIFPELDWLINQLLYFIKSCPEDVCYKKTELCEDIKRAFKSEVYMYKSVLQKSTNMEAVELELLTDKSIAFEKVALLTTLYGYNSSESIIAAEAMANIFWLLDDLCDFVEDVQANRKNSLLVFNNLNGDTYSLEQRVETAFQNLDATVNLLFEKISVLRNVAGEDLYIFMMNQIWKWSFNIREFCNCE